jgi:hypothetical protein
MHSRRDAILGLAAGALAPALNGQHVHTPEPLLQISQPLVPKTISTDDFPFLGKLVDLFIPRTDTPGASDVGVPIYVDRVAGRRPEVATALKDGLAKLRAGGFFEAGSADQVARLTAMEAAGDPFFRLVKDLTIDGYYSSRDGLTKELGYHGNTFLKEFTGCTHPEHQHDA